MEFCYLKIVYRKWTAVVKSRHLGFFRPQTSIFGNEGKAGEELLSSVLIGKSL